MSKKMKKKSSRCKEESANIILITMVMVFLFAICGYFMYDLSARDEGNSNQQNTVMYQA